MENQRTILIIDDEPEVADMLRKSVEEAGHRGVVAYDGFEGIKIANAVKPHLILLDLQMPKMPGAGVLGSLRMKNGKSLFPIIIMSNDVSQASMYNDFDTHGFLEKPINIEEVLKNITRHFNAHPVHETGTPPAAGNGAFKTGEAA